MESIKSTTRGAGLFDKVPGVIDRLELWRRLVNVTMVRVRVTKLNWEKCGTAEKSC